MIAKPQFRDFAALWFIAGNCVWLPAFGLGVLLFGGGLEVFRLVSGSPNPADWAADAFFGIVSFGIATGFCVGIVQQLIVSKTLKLDMRGWWRVSVLGGLLGALLFQACIDLTAHFQFGWGLELGPSVSSIRYVAVPSIPLVISLAAVQAIWLLRKAVGARFWLFTHVLAIVLPPALAVYAALALDLVDLFRSSLWWQVYLCIVVIASGWAMQRIARRSLRGDKAKRKPVALAA